MFPNAILKKSMIGFDKPDDALILFDKMLNTLQEKAVLPMKIAKGN